MAYTAVKLTDVTKAINDVKAAQKKYDDAVKNSGAKSSIKTAVDTAQKKLEEARTKLDTLQSDFDNQKFATAPNVVNASKALGKSQSYLDNQEYLKTANITALQKAVDTAKNDAARAVAQKKLDTAISTAELNAQKDVTIKQKAYDSAFNAAQLGAQKAIDAQAYLINGEKNKNSLELLYNNKQNAYQKILDEIQPDLDARNEAIGRVSDYIGTIKGSLGDITKKADADAVKTMLTQIGTAVKGTGISDFQSQIDPLIKEIDPLKMSNIPQLSSAFKSVNPDVFSNIDRTTGLPILNQTALDKVLTRYGGNTLTSSQYRDNYNAFGWNSKSDGSQVAQGAAILGLKIGNAPATGMGAQGLNKEVLNSKGQVATQADFKKAADQLHLDINNYIKPTKFVPQQGAYGSIEVANNRNSKIYTDPNTGESYLARTDAKGNFQTTFDKQGLYNEINNRTKDFYLVANAIEFKGANNPSEHAAVLFRADGSGNLVPVVDENGNPQASYYKTPTVIHEGSGLGDFLPVLAIAGSFFLPGITAGLAGAIEGTALGTALGTAGSAAMAGAITNAGLAAITGGDIGQAALMGGAGALSTVKSADIANGALGGVENVQKIADITGLNLAQTQKIIADGVVTGLASGAVDPDNVLQNVTSSVASGFTSTQAKNAVQDIMLGNPAMNTAADVASNITNVATQAATRGVDVMTALQYAAPQIAGSGLGTALQTATTPIQEGLPGSTTVAQQQVYDAFGRPVSALPNLGTYAGSNIDISGMPLLQENSELLKGALPQGQRLATFDEAMQDDLRATTLENGQMAFLKPITPGEQVSAYDYSSLQNQAGAGALSSVLGNASTAPGIIDEAGNAIYLKSAAQKGNAPWTISDGTDGTAGSLPGVTVTANREPGAGEYVYKNGMPQLPEVTVTANREPGADEYTYDNYVGQSFPLTEKTEPAPGSTPQIGPMTGSTTGTGALSLLSTPTLAGGAAPAEPTPTMLTSKEPQGAYDQILQLKQLYPQLANVDDQLLNVMLQRKKPADYYTYGSQAPSPLDMYTQAAVAPDEQAAPAPQEDATTFITPSQPSYSAANMLGLTQTEAQQQPFMFKKGGDVHVPEFITGKTGYYVEGEGDGQSDSIPAMLADGEYVFDADTVAALGNGSNKAGAAVLDKMRESIRKHKRAASHKKIPPPAKSPLEYLKG